MSEQPTKEQYEKLIEALEEFGTPRSYSGRGMFGSQCLGITTDEPLRVLALVSYALGLVDGENEVAGSGPEYQELVGKFANARMDSMGRSTILYWPTIEWRDDVEVAEDEEGYN